MNDRKNNHIHAVIQSQSFKSGLQLPRSVCLNELMLLACSKRYATVCLMQWCRTLKGRRHGWVKCHTYNRHAMRANKNRA